MLSGFCPVRGMAGCRQNRAWRIFSLSRRWRKYRGSVWSDNFASAASRHRRGLCRVIASAERSRRGAPIGHESFAEILFRNVKGLGRRGPGGGLQSTRKLFVLVGIRQLRVWAQEAVNQFALLLLGIACRRQSKKSQDEQAGPHRFRLRNPDRFVKKKTPKSWQ